MSKHRVDSKFTFVGNSKCIDFVNTELIKGGQIVDLLENFVDLVTWLTTAEILNTLQSKQILESWNNTQEGEQTLRVVREFRTILKRAVERIVAGKKTEQLTVKKINEYLRHQCIYTKLTEVGGRFEKTQHSDFNEPIKLLAPIAAAASDLFCSADFGLVRKCESESCVLYFYDITKNHARRWCSMSSCGNRMKVAAHYQRLRQSQS